MKHLSDTSLFLSIFSHCTVPVTSELTLHQLHTVLQKNGVHHLLFATRTQGLQILENVLPFYEQLYPHIAFISSPDTTALLARDSQALEEALIEYTSADLLFLEISRQSAALATFSLLYKTMLDLNIQNTISMVIVSYGDSSL